MHLLNQKKIMITKNSIERFITSLYLLTTLSVLFYCPAITRTAWFIIASGIMLTELKKMIHNKTAFYLVSLFYIITPCGILIYFNHSQMYQLLLVYIFITVFSFDSSCYIIGKLCSRFWITKKIVPHISPGKSYEGFFGGYIFTTLIIFFLANQNYSNAYRQLYIISAAICLTAFLGDIFESYLKRSVNIKDSGTILPGHGGMLDRFDGVLAVSYLFFICKNYVIQIF